MTFVKEREIILNFCNVQSQTNTDNLYKLSKETKQFLLKIVNYILLKNRGNVDLAKKFNLILGVKDSDINNLLNMGYKYVKILDRGKSGTGLLVINNNNNKKYVAKIYDKIQKKRLNQEIKWQNNAAELEISPKIVAYNDKYRIIIMEKLEKTMVEKFIEDGCSFSSHMLVSLAKIFRGLDFLKIYHGDPGLSNFMYDQNGNLKIIDFSDATLLKKGKSNFFTLTEIYYRFLKVIVFSCFSKDYTPDDKLKSSLDYITISKGERFYRGMAKRFADKKLTGLRWITKDKKTAQKYTTNNGVLLTLEAKQDFKVLNMSKEGSIKLLKYVWANNYQDLFILLFQTFVNPNKTYSISDLGIFTQITLHFKYNLSLSFNKNLEKFENLQKIHRLPLPKVHISMDEIIKNGKRFSSYTEDREFTEILCEMGFNGYSAPDLPRVNSATVRNGVFPAEEAICNIEKFFEIVEIN